MKTSEASEYAIKLVHEFYYTLPNNGSHNTGINSCHSRYGEAIKCAHITVNRIKQALNNSNALEGNLQDSDEAKYWDKVTQELHLIELQNIDRM